MGILVKRELDNIILVDCRRQCCQLAEPDKLLNETTWVSFYGSPDMRFFTEISGFFMLTARFASE